MTDINDEYFSIEGCSEGLFKDNGSRFIALAYNVESEEQVKDIVSSLKKQYHDARHHCYAYRIGHTGEKMRANDDGEPSGSAGRPILGQIDSKGLSDVLVVVVRYFGGIKLGIPGLIRAYKSSTADALEKATIVRRIACRRFRIGFDYLSMNKVMKVIKDLSLEVSGQVFDTTCSMEVKVRLNDIDKFLSSLNDIDGCEITER